LGGNAYRHRSATEKLGFSVPASRHELKKQSTGLFFFTVRAIGVQFSSIYKTKRHQLVSFCFMVEMRRIELLSENSSVGTSTGLVYGLAFFPAGHRKRSPLGHSLLYLTC